LAFGTSFVYCESTSKTRKSGNRSNFCSDCKFTPQSKILFLSEYVVLFALSCADVERENAYILYCYETL
jgi:hypothetical protein